VHVAVSWMCGLLFLRLLLHFQKLLLLFTAVTWTQTHQMLPCMSPYPGCVACSLCIRSCISRNCCCCSCPLIGHRCTRCCRACRRILDVWPAPFAFAPAFPETAAVVHCRYLDTDASDAAVHVAVSWMCGLLSLHSLLHFLKLLLLFTAVTWTQTHQMLPCMLLYPGCVACSLCIRSCIS